MLYNLIASWSLYVKDGIVKYVYNWFDTDYFYVEATEKLSTGTSNIRYHFDFDGSPVALAPGDL